MFPEIAARQINSAESARFYRDRLADELSLIATSSDPVAIPLHQALANAYRAMLEAAGAIAGEGEASNSRKPARRADRPGAPRSFHPSKYELTAHPGRSAEKDIAGLADQAAT